MSTVFERNHKLKNVKRDTLETDFLETFACYLKKSDLIKREQIHAFNNLSIVKTLLLNTLENQCKPLAHSLFNWVQFHTSF